MNYFWRKKPVVVQAFQMTRERRQDNADWPEWLHRAWNMESTERGALWTENEGISRTTNDSLLRIFTLEGVHVVDWNDYIIRGLKGEIYPCKPDIFLASYEECEEEESDGN